MDDRVQSEPRGPLGGGVGALLLLAAAFIAALPAWLAPQLLFASGGSTAGAWPGVRSLAIAPEGSGALVAWRVLLVVVLACGGGIAARLAVALGASRRVALAGGLLFVASSAATSVLWMAAGPLLLVAALAGLLFLERRLAAPQQGLLAAALLVVATVASSGVLLPTLLGATVVLAPVGRARRRVLAGLALLLLPVAAALLLRWPLGLALGAAPSSAAQATLHDALLALRDAMRTLLEGGFGFVAARPFVSNWRPELGSSIGSPLLVLSGLAVLVSAVQRPAARALLAGVLVAVVPILLVAIGRPLQLVPLALALPGVALVGAALAALQPKVAYAAGVLLLGLQAAGSVQQRELRANLLHVAHPVAAQRLAELDGEPSALEACVVAAAAAPRALAPEVERAIGWQLLLAAEQAGDEARALDWAERWLAARPASAAPFPELEARRIELLLPVRGVDAVAAELSAGAARHAGERAWVSAVAAVMVEALHRSARDPQFVTQVVPLVEQLLETAAARPDDASSAELQCLALLRVGQQRLIEAVTLAEKAVARAPDDARPHLVLARIYLGRDEWEAGLREVARARQLDRDDPSAILLEGRLFCSNADLAERGVERMLAARVADPTLPGVREEIEAGTVAAAGHLVAQGRLEAARDALHRAIEAIGRRPPLLRSLASVARQQRAFEAAVVLLEEVWEAGAGDAVLARELAEARRDAGYGRLLQHDRPAAIAHFERALAIAPPEFDRAGMEAVVAQYRSEGKRSEPPEVAAARAAFDEALRLHGAGDVEGALAALKRSIELLPLHPLAHLNLGRIELERGRAKEAEGALRTALAIAAAQKIDLEEAWPPLLEALVAQAADAKEIAAALDEYARLYPRGRFLAQLEALRDR
ncbi:MAG: hypothetical protein JNL90_08755 [Planctomycetes bacterium]|nr:hypothetical protein [Planctomycetota bacterium]